MFPLTILDPSVPPQLLLLTVSVDSMGQIRDSSLSGSRSSLSSRGRSPRDSTFDRDSPTPRLPRPRRHDHREPRSGNLKKVGHLFLYTTQSFICKTLCIQYSFHIYILKNDSRSSFVHRLTACQDINVFNIILLTCNLFCNSTALFQVDGRVGRGGFSHQIVPLYVEHAS